MEIIMKADTEIRFYVHTNSNAPKLNNVYGCMINVLDACLVNGFGTQTVMKLSADGTTITADFGVAHNLLQYQVVNILGADQKEFNGVHRILSTTQNTIIFSVDVAPLVNVATGASISASLAPAGWDKPYSSSNSNGGGRAAYKSKNNNLNSAPFIRVVDELDSAWTATYAKYAKVGIVSDMASIDDISGLQTPFDSSNKDKNWVGSGSGSSAYNGWAKWYYSRNVDALNATSDSVINAVNTNLDSISTVDGDRTWFIVASSTFFYIFNNTTANIYAPAQNLKGIAMLESEGANRDWALFADFSYSMASETKYGYYYTGLTYQDYNNTTSPRCYIHTPSVYKVAFSSTFNLSKARDNYTVSGANNYVSGYNSNLTFLPVYCVGLADYTQDLGVILGKLPSILWLPTYLPFSDKQSFNDGSNMFIAKTCAAYMAVGQVVFKLGVL